MVKFWDGFLFPSHSSRLFLLPHAWPNPEAQHHCSISVTFDGPGLKQISIPLVDFKRCFNNDASQGRANEACSGPATSDFKIILISQWYISAAPALTVCPFHLSRFCHIPLLNFRSRQNFSLLFFELCSSLSPSYFLFPLSFYSPVGEAWLN